MGIKWKNITKIFVFVLSAIILSIYIAGVSCIYQAGRLDDMRKGTEYYKTNVHLSEIQSAFQDVVKHEKDKSVLQNNHYSYFYATVYKVLDNKIDYVAETEQARQVMGAMKEKVLEDQEDYISSQDNVEYSLMAFQKANAYAITNWHSSCAKGKMLNKEFKGDEIEFLGGSKPSGAMVVVVFQDSYLTKMNTHWQKICVAFQVATGLAVVALLGMFWSVLCLCGLSKRKWKWNDLHILFAFTGILMLFERLTQDEDLVLYPLMNGGSAFLLIKPFCRYAVSTLFLIMITGSAIISAYTLLVQKKWIQKAFIYMLHKKIRAKIREKNITRKSVWNAFKKFWEKLIAIVLGTNKYPDGISRGTKRLVRSVGALLCIMTVGFVTFMSYVYKVYSSVPVGYSVVDARMWYGKGKIPFEKIILNPKGILMMCCVYSVLILLVFAFYLYLNRKVYESFMLLEQQIKKLHDGENLIDTTAVEGTVVYGDILLLSEVGEGFEKNLEEKLKSERMKVELITNVSHDLKTPLTSIISYIDLLKRDGNLSEKAMEYVDILDRKSERLKHIVQDVFELAKTTSGEVVIDKKELNINKLLIQTVSDFEDRIQASGMEVRLQTLEKDVIILSDGGRIYRVLQNLLDNALKYAMPGTRIYVREEIRRNDIVVDWQKNETAKPNDTESENNMLWAKNPTEECEADVSWQDVISITNTSSYEIDFSSEEAMERFFRGDRSRQTEGSGLGLAIARAFTIACGGKFDIQIDGDQFKVSVAFFARNTEINMK